MQFFQQRRCGVDAISNVDVFFRGDEIRGVAELCLGKHLQQIGDRPFPYEPCRKEAIDIAIGQNDFPFPTKWLRDRCWTNAFSTKNSQKIRCIIVGKSGSACESPFFLLCGVIDCLGSPAPLRKAHSPFSVNTKTFCPSPNTPHLINT